MVLVTVDLLCLCSSLSLCFSPVLGLFVPCFLACSSPVLVSSRSFLCFLALVLCYSSAHCLCVLKTKAKLGYVGFFPPLVLFPLCSGLFFPGPLPIFSVQDEDDGGGLSTRSSG
uniref:Uncharacterized protein n=1 Tax=Populus davidiana TaxID=266767 RepID=A0A6M2F3X1_9ROSI